MSEMVERVTKAIEKARGNEDRMARAAIEAMREPTEDMLRAGVISFFGPSAMDNIVASGEMGAQRDQWQSMIDTALRSPRGQREVNER